jgi:thymidylate kinase/thymidylate synthase ThyX
MQNKEGVFIVIEGTDGSGKGTQFKLLMERLQLAGYDVADFDFPRYDEASSYFVKEYLNGKYGSADEVGPYTASLFYALDRYEAATQIREALKAGKVVLANRFTGSNMAHQGTKFHHADERRGYFIWLDNLEFEMLHIPRPDLNIVLRVPADIAQTLVDKKEKRSYTDKKRDIHEADLGHLERAVEVYDDLCQLFPKDYMRIDCVRNDQLLPIETVSNLMWEKVFPYLPKPSRPRKVAKAETTKISSITTENPYIEKTNGDVAITELGHTYLEEAVTDPTGPVYAFTDTTNSAAVAAAMARMSHHDDDIRATILEEFAHAKGKDEQVLEQAISEYGDDAVRQLVGLNMVVEGASNLLTKKLEWGRLATYFEQPLNQVAFERRDANGHYKYYIPDNFDTATRQQYCTHMDEIFDLYATMVHQLTHYIRETSTTSKIDQDRTWKAATRAEARNIMQVALPIATKSTIGMYLSAQALEGLTLRLQSDPLPEAQVVGKQLLEQAQKAIPGFLDQASANSIGGVEYRALTARAVKDIATSYLSENHAVPNLQAVDLVDVWPRNELDLVPDMLYEHSNTSLRELQTVVGQWSYDKKVSVYQTYMGERLQRQHKPGRALEKIHYSWDLVCEYGVFRELQRHRMVDDLEWQQLTPRFGYDIPAMAEAAGLSDTFDTCFDLSLKLHSLLQQKGYELESQYATLFGHNMRWKVTYNAREAFHLHELNTSPQASGLITRMHEKISEMHPILGEAMKFVATSKENSTR